MLKSATKKVLSFLFNRLEIYHALCFDCGTSKIDSKQEKAGMVFKNITAEVIRNHCDEILSKQLWWGANVEGSIGHAVLINRQVAAVAWSWTSKECHRRNDWQIDDRDVFLVEMFVSPKFRGMGLSSALYRFAMADLSHRGYRRIFGRAWYDHHATLSVLHKLGWQRIAVTVFLVPFVGPPLRFSFPRRRNLLPISFKPVREA